MTSPSTCHHLSPEPMTDALFPQAWMTGVTGESDIPNRPLVTGDTSSPVPPHNARRSRETGNAVTPVTSHPQLPLLPTDRYITERAQLGRCRRCNQPVIRADQIGWHTSTDPHHLTALEELTEALAGRRTFELVATAVAHRPLLRPRFTPDIRRRPGLGLREHHCDRPAGPVDQQLLDQLLPPRPEHQPTDTRIDPKAPF